MACQGGVAMETSSADGGRHASPSTDLPSHLSVYTVPSPVSTSSTRSSPASLLPLALTADTLLDSVVLIALDWEKPSQFVEELQSRLAEVRACVQEIEKQKGKAWIVQEGRDSGELCPMPCLV